MVVSHFQCCLTLAERMRRCVSDMQKSFTKYAKEPYKMREWELWNIAVLRFQRCIALAERMRVYQTRTRAL